MSCSTSIWCLQKLNATFYTILSNLANSSKPCSTLTTFICTNLIYKSNSGGVCLFVCVGSAWKILLVTARSLWSFPICNFPRCNWFQRKKKSGVVWFFEAKDLVDQKKKIRPWIAQNFIYLLFCIDQDYLFFLLATVRPN
jgi:hypothetical protein